MSPHNPPTKPPSAKIAVSPDDPLIRKYTVPQTSATSHHNPKFDVTSHTSAQTDKVIIKEVTKGSLAEELGIEPGDELISVNDVTHPSGEVLYTRFIISIWKLFHCINSNPMQFEMKRYPPPASIIVPSASSAQEAPAVSA